MSEPSQQSDPNPWAAPGTDKPDQQPDSIQLVAAGCLSVFVGGLTLVATCCGIAVSTDFISGSVEDMIGIGFVLGIVPAIIVGEAIYSRMTRPPEPTPSKRNRLR